MLRRLIAKRPESTAAVAATGMRDQIDNVSTAHGAVTRGYPPYNLPLHQGMPGHECRKEESKTTFANNGIPPSSQAGGSRSVPHFLRLFRRSRPPILSTRGFLARFDFLLLSCVLVLRMFRATRLLFLVSALICVNVTYDSYISLVSAFPFYNVSYTSCNYLVLVFLSLMFHTLRICFGLGLHFLKFWECFVQVVSFLSWPSLFKNISCNSYVFF